MASHGPVTRDPDPAAGPDSPRVARIQGFSGADPVVCESPLISWPLVERGGGEAGIYAPNHTADYQLFRICFADLTIQAVRALGRHGRPESLPAPPAADWG